jgi:DNA-binding winged helix-turn-helix (wHTH) protein/Tfp pilus assembly protein PilF
MPARERHEFGPFVLDVTERRLAREDHVVALAPKAFDLLVALVRKGGQLVTKAELLDTVWPSAFVEEGVLAVHVSALRNALGDDSQNPRYIETIRRSGYRFVAPLCAAVPPATPNGSDRELVGRGRFHLLSASRSEVPKALAAFREAAGRDPDYAAAHAGEALACCAQAELRLAPPSEAYEQARSAALRALAMDAGCADAQVALGVVLFLCDWNWRAAERCFQRALQLNPQHTEAFLLYGRLLDTRGRHAEALEMKLRALERDPLSPTVHLQIALSYWNQRRFDEVIEWANKTLALDPRHLLAREYLAGVYWAKGDTDRQMAEDLEHARSYGVPDSQLEPLRAAYAAGGRRAVVAYTLDGARRNGQSLPAVQLAIMHGELGEFDAAFEHLDRAIDARDPSVIHLAVSPQWDALRGDPRFPSRVARLGL